MTRITDSHIEHYQEHGYAIVENFLTADELSRSYEEIERFKPGWIEFSTNPDGPKPDDWNLPRHSRADVRFPFAGTQLNANTLHPELRRFAGLMCQSSDLFCEQSDMSFKCQGNPADREQNMHLDYSNHTLVYPPNDPKYWQTAYLLYYTDVDKECAPTAVCSKQHYEGELHWPPGHSREDRPELYDNEVETIVPAGSLLMYSMRTYHRGTAFKGNRARVAQFITYSPTGYPWLGIVSWPEQGTKAAYREWVENATVEERNLLGFPRPGDPYWTEETLKGVSARFPAMDLGPYTIQ